MENITRVIKPEIIRGQLQDPESTDIFVPNTLDKYASRPDSLENMCLADFASEYRNESMKNPKINDESIESYTQPVSDHIDTADSSVIIDLKNDLGKMKKRSRPCVIRWHKLSKLNEPEQYFMTMLQLYFP